MNELLDHSAKNQLEQILEALKAVRDVNTNHRGLQSLRRQLLRSKPAADALLAGLLTTSPHLVQLHNIWEVQVSAKDLLVALELCSLCTTLLRYRPSPSCSSQQRQHIQHGLDLFAASLVQSRLKAIYFHLSSSNRARSNAALALLTAISNRGGAVLRELVACFDFSLSVLPKLARPPKAAEDAAAAAPAADADAAAAGGGGSKSAAAAAVSRGEQQPAHWLSWNSPQMSKRPSRAMFVGWVAAMVSSADPLLLPVLLRTRVLMGGLLNHLSTDPPGIISGVLALLQRRVLGDSGRVLAAVQYELWTDSALQQLATISAAAVGESMAAGRNDTAAAAAGCSGGAGVQQRQHASNSDSGSSNSSEDEGEEDDSDSEGGAVDSQQQQKQQAQTTDDDGDTAAAAAAAAAAKLTADAAHAAYSLLLLLLTDPTQGLIAATAPLAVASTVTNASSGSSRLTPGERRVLRLLQWLQPGHHPSHARLLQAVADAQPRLAAELLQGLSYQLEPKPCGTWLGCVAAVGQLIAAAATAGGSTTTPSAASPSQLMQQVMQTRLLLHECELSSSSSNSSGGRDGGGVGVLHGLSGAAAAAAAPDVDGPVVKYSLGSCLPPVLTKGVLSRGLQHSSPLVLAGSLSLMQRALAALQQQLLLPIEEVAAAAAAVVVQQHHSSPLPDQQLQAQAAPLLQQHSAQVQQDYQQLLSLQQQEQPQRVHSDAVTPVQTSQHADVLRAVASGWCSLLHSLRLSLRHKLPDISVLVAVITSLQRSSAAAAPDGSGPSTAGKASAAGPKQHPQQQQPCYCDRSQAQWLLPQAYSVLAAYARWMPEAVADGHVDLGKLLLQGQGQELLLAPSEVQQAALAVLLAADDAAAAAPRTDADAAALASSAAGAGSSVQQQAAHAFNLPALPVSLLLPLLRLAAAAPSGGVRAAARRLLQARLAPYCSDNNSSSCGDGSVEAALWLQHLPPIWQLVGVAAAIAANPSTGEGAGAAAETPTPTPQHAEASATAAVLEAVLGCNKQAVSTTTAAAAAADAGRDDAAPTSGSSSSCLDSSWLSAQVAVLGFVAEAVAAVERKPQEPWELIQTALQPCATTPAALVAAGRDGVYAECSSSSSSTPPSLFAVCVFRRLLRLLKSSKAAPTVKAAVCGYVCGVWQQLLHQQLDQTSVLAVLGHMLHAEGSEWRAGAGQHLGDVSGAAATVGGGAGGGSAEDPEGSRGSKRKKQKQQQQVKEQRKQDDGLPLLLLLPPEASCIVSLYSKAAELQAAAGSPLSLVIKQQQQQQQQQQQPAAHAASVSAAAADSGKKKKRKQSDLAGQQQQQQEQHPWGRLQLQARVDTVGGQQQQQQRVQQLLQVLDHPTTTFGAGSRSSSKHKKQQLRSAANAGLDATAHLCAGAQAWQELQLLLLASAAPTVVQTAAIAVAACLWQPPEQQQQQQIQYYHMLARQLLSAVLASHGLSWAHVAAAAAVAAEDNDPTMQPPGSSSSGASSITAAAGLLLGAADADAGPPVSMQLVALQVLSCFEVSTAQPSASAASAGAAAADVAVVAAAAPWRLVEDANWRCQQLLQLQRLSVQHKLQLVGPVSCGLVRVAAAAAAAGGGGSVKRKHAGVLLTYGIQLLQALLVADTHSTSSDAGGLADSAAASQQQVTVSHEVLSCLLQQWQQGQCPMLLRLFADSSPDAAAAGSKQLTKHLVLLLQWLLGRGVAADSSAGAAAGFVGGSARRAAGDDADGVVVSACTPFLLKALGELQHQASTSGTAAAFQVGVAGAQQQISEQEQPSLAAAVSLQLLQALVGRSSSSNGVSSSSSRMWVEADVLAAIQRVVSGLLPVTAASGVASAPIGAESRAPASSKKAKHRKGGSTATASAGAAPSGWQAALLLAAAQVLSTAAPDTAPGRVQQLPSALVQFLLATYEQGSSSGMDDFIAAALGATSSSTRSTFISPFLQLSAADSLRLMTASLRQPLTATRVSVAAQLLLLSQHSAALAGGLTAQQQQLCSAFASGLQQCLSTAAAEVAGGVVRRETLALLLPAAAAYLTATHAAVRSQQQQQQQQQQLDEGDPVVAVYRPALLAFIQLKPRTTPTAQPSQPSKQQQQQQGAVADAGVSSAAAVCLQRHAVPVLQLCLQQQPLDAAGSSKLLKRLLPGKGYAASAAAAGGAGVDVPSGDYPAPLQQLQLATWMLQHQQQQQQQQTAQAAGGSAPGDDAEPADMDAHEATGDQQQQQQQQLLVNVSAFVTCVCNTLCAIHKQHPLRSQSVVSAATTSAVPVNSSSSGGRGGGGGAQHSQLEVELLQQLDGWAGDILADLPDHLRTAPAAAPGPTSQDVTAPGSSSSSSAVAAAAFAAVVAAAQHLALSILKHRFGDSSSMRCLRRLLAALLPGGTAAAAAGDDSGDKQQQPFEAVAADAGADGTDAAAAADGGHTEESDSMDVDVQVGSDDEPPTDRQHQAKKHTPSGSSSDSGSSDDDDGSSSDTSSSSSSDDTSGSSEDTSVEDLTPSDTEMEDSAARGHAHARHAAAQDAPSTPPPPAAAGADVVDAEAAEATVGGEDDEGVEDTCHQAPVVERTYNPAAAAAAQQLLKLVVAHSGFVPALLVAGHQQQQQVVGVLPAAVAAVATPLASYMPVVQAIWSCGGGGAGDAQQAATPDSITSSGSSDNAAQGFKHQLVLLLEVLLDMCKLYTSEQQQQQQGQQGGSIDSSTEDDSMSEGEEQGMQGVNGCGGGGVMDAAALGLEPQLLQSLLQLLQVAYGASLSDVDRAVLRVLLQIDALVPLVVHPQQQQQQQQDDEQEEDKQEQQQQQQYPLPWPRCLFGKAARLFYERQHHKQQQQQQQVVNTDGASEFLQQLLQERCPLDPLRCALTVVLFPDRRCLNPDDEPPGDDTLTHLYYSSSSSSGSGGSSSSGSSSSSAADAAQGAFVCAGAAAAVAAAGYDPVPLLLLGLRGLQEGVLDVDSFAACGLIGVVLRALAAEDGQLRAIAHDCMSMLLQLMMMSSSSGGGSSSGSSQSNTGFGGSAAGGQHQLQVTLRVFSGAGGGGKAPFGSMQQLLKSSKRSNQLHALLLWVSAGINNHTNSGGGGAGPDGVNEQQHLLPQQIPTAAAVLAAEASLLLAAPGHAMGAVVRKLMVRQKALDTSGLPLFGRIMTGSGSSSSVQGAGGGGGGGGSSSRKRAAGQADGGGAGATDGAGAGGSLLRGAAAVMAERQWLLQLLWMGLRVPSDGRLYRQKRVCETLMALWGTSHSHMLNTASTTNTTDLATHSFAAAGGVCAGGNSSGQGLDGFIAQVLAQAVHLPGLAGHLIRSAGLLPWLTDRAVADVSNSSIQTLALSTAAAAAAAGGVHVLHNSRGMLPHPSSSPSYQGSWSLRCLQQLLAGRVALSHNRQPQQVADAFAAYTHAVMHLAAAVLSQLPMRGVCGGSSGRIAGVAEGMAGVHALLQILQLLVLLLRAAPSGRAARQLKQLLQGNGGVGGGGVLWQQLSAAVCDAATSVGSGDTCRRAGGGGVALLLLQESWQHLLSGLEAV